MSKPTIFTNPANPQCQYCLAQHAKGDHCRCYICHTEMHHEFIRCITIDDTKTVLCPECDKTTHRFNLVKLVTELGSRLLPKSLAGYPDDCKTARDETMQLTLEAFTPLFTALRQPAGSIYTIHYDLHNGSPDTDFFFNEAQRNAKLQTIMEEVIEECKKFWDVHPEKIRQACIEVEQMISQGEIVEAFYSTQWEQIHHEFDSWYLHECEIPDYITKQPPITAIALSKAVSVIRCMRDLLADLHNKHLPHTDKTIRDVVKQRIEVVDELLGRKLRTDVAACAEAYQLGKEHGVVGCGKANPYDVHPDKATRRWASYEHGYVDGCMARSH